MKSFLFSGLLLIIAISGFAQADPQFSQYMFNGLVINPAYAGYREKLNVSLLHRDQWTGVEGRPQTQTFIIDGALGNDKKVGLGISLLNDDVGLQKRSAVNLNYAYRLIIGEDARLAMGVSLGLNQYLLDASSAQIETVGDPSFQVSSSFLTPAAALGIYFSNEKLFSGFSMTNLMPQFVYKNLRAQQSLAQAPKHYFFTAGSLINLNEQMILKPSFLFKKVIGESSSLDVNSSVLLNKKFWLGLSLRSNVNLLANNSLNNDIFSPNSLIGVSKAVLLFLTSIDKPIETS